MRQPVATAQAMATPAGVTGIEEDPRAFRAKGIAHARHVGRKKTLGAIEGDTPRTRILARLHAMTREVPCVVGLAPDRSEKAGQRRGFTSHLTRLAVHHERRILALESRETAIPGRDERHAVEHDRFALVLPLGPAGQIEELRQEEIAVWRFVGRAIAGCLERDHLPRHPPLVGQDLEGRNPVTEAPKLPSNRLGQQLPPDCNAVRAQALDGQTLISFGFFGPTRDLFEDARDVALGVPPGHALFVTRATGDEIGGRSGQVHLEHEVTVFDALVHVERHGTFDRARELVVGSWLGTHIHHPLPLTTHRRDALRRPPEPSGLVSRIPLLWTETYPIVKPTRISSGKPRVRSPRACCRRGFE